MLKNIFFYFQPALPKVIDDDEDMDYEDEEDFSMHGHALIDELELHLASGEDIEKMPQILKKQQAHDNGQSYGISFENLVFSPNH